MATNTLHHPVLRLRPCTHARVLCTQVEEWVGAIRAALDRLPEIEPTPAYRLPTDADEMASLSASLADYVRAPPSLRRAIACCERRGLGAAGPLRPSDARWSAGCH